MGNDTKQKVEYRPLVWREYDDGWGAASTVYDLNDGDPPYFLISEMKPVKVIDATSLHEGRWGIDRSASELIPEDWEGVLWAELDEAKEWCEQQNRLAHESEHGE